jgi:hypothetical protein
MSSTCVNVCDIPGLALDGVTDDGPALQAALDANPGRKIFFPTLDNAGKPLVAFSSITLRPKGGGQSLCGEGQGYQQGPKIKFPAGVSGISMENARCPGALVENLFLEGSEFWWSAYPKEAILPKGFAGALENTPPHGISEADGVRVGANFSRVKNCTIMGFGRCAVNAGNALTGGVSDDLYLEDVYLLNCRGWGLYLQGGDSNAGKTCQVRAYTCQLGAILDDSFLGNVHDAPHCEACHQDNTPNKEATAIWQQAGVQGGSYESDRTGVFNLWLNPYAEGGQGQGARLNGHNLVVCGDIAEYAPGYQPAFLRPDGSGRMLVNALRAVMSGTWCQVGAGDSTPTAFSWGRSGDTQDWRMQWCPPGQLPLWYLLYGNTAAQSPLAFAGSGAGVRPGSLAFPLGYNLIYGGQFLTHDCGPAPPTSGTYRAGSTRVNTTPVPGGKAGWVCVTSGSPGVWKGCGTIDP